MKKLLCIYVCAVCCFFSGISAEEMPNMNIIHLDPSQLDNVEMSAIQDLPFMKVMVGDNPEANNLSIFVSSDNKVSVDISSYTQITLKLTDWPVDEYMYFLEGQVEITDKDGSSRVYGPGDSIVMPRGFTGTWKQLSPIRKISVSYPVDQFITE